LPARRAERARVQLCAAESAGIPHDCLALLRLYAYEPE
jgi:hypothetical protein